jgi:hypothetical protein
MTSDLKILFVSFIGDLKHSSKGFVKKDLEKAEAINNVAGVECIGITFAEDIDADYYFKPNYLVKKLPGIKKRKFFGSFFQDRHEYDQLDRFLENQNFDVLIFRYNIASFALHKITKKYRKKIIFEHNTFEYVEHSLQIDQRRALLNFSLKPGYFLYYFEGKFWPLFCEHYFGPKIRNNAKAGISVTREIANYEMNYAPGYKNVVITNGVKYQADLLHTPPPYSGAELHLFMLIGTGANWHGVDRLINGLKNYRGLVNIKIDLIGFYYAEDRELVKKLGLSEHIRFLDPMSGPALNSQLNNYHISLGTLALHRKNLKEAAPLKVRESLMRGFPNIIAYTDPDFEKRSEINNYILNLPADDTPIKFETVVDFANRVLSGRDYPKRISELAEPQISYEAKARETVEFIRTLMYN